MKTKLRLLIAVALVIPCALVFGQGSTEQAQSLGDGVHVGSKTTDRVGFHDATPTVQAAATLTSRAVLQAKGLLATDGTITATATAGAATLDKTVGRITSEALTTAAAAAYTLTLTNATVAAASVVVASVDNGTNTQGIPVVGLVTPAAGSVVIKVYNLHASEALNGTIKVNFAVLK